MATLKCKNCGKSAKAKEELVNYTEDSQQPVIMIELTATCSCGAQLKDWQRLSREELLEGLAAFGAYAQAATSMPKTAAAAQRNVWDTEGF